jgi:hypothetical protein
VQITWPDNRETVLVLLRLKTFPDCGRLPRSNALLKHQLLKHQLLKHQLLKHQLDVGREIR